MAETPHKRLREESYHINIEDSIHEFHDSSVVSKRQKPYNNSNNVNILNLLDEEDDEEAPSRDLSAIFTTLQQELLSTTTTTTLDNFDSLPPPSVAAVAEAELSHHHVTSAECGGGVADENDGVKSVMRHLFEASDDELGIPNRNDDDENNNIEENIPFSFNDQYHGLWELEDEAANYYTVLQSELFMKSFLPLFWG